MNVASADHDARTGVRVAVTGVRGVTADALLTRLAADPDLGRVVVVDRERPARLPAGVQFVRADLRDALLSRLFADVDVVVNAVLADDVTRFRRDLLATSVQSTRRVLDAADAAGVGALVHVSSAMVYGAAERNRVPLTEQEPLRAAARFAAVQEALHAEEAVRAYLAVGGRGAFVGAHWGTFRLTDEDPLEPPERARRAWEEAGLPAADLHLTADDLAEIELRIREALEHAGVSR